MTDKKRRAKGSGSIYKRADGYYVGVVELPPHPDGRRRRKQIVRKSKKAVENAQKEARRELDMKGDIRTEAPKVGAWLAEWIELRAANGKLRPRTASTYRGYLRRYIDPHVGRFRIDKLSPAHVERMTAAMIESGVSPTTAIQAQNILKGALKAAENKGHVSRNVAKLAEAPEAAFYEAATLTLDQARAVLNWASAQGPLDAARWGLALLAGLRQGEALGLTRQCVDLDALELRIAWQLQALDTPPAQSLASHHISGRMWLTEPKSERGVRIVPIVQPLALALEARLRQIDSDPWAFVISDSEGRPRDASKDAKMWATALRAARVPRVRLHDARHTTGTLLRAAGVEPRIIQAILGHNTAAMTERYSHLGANEKALAMDQFVKLIEGSSP